MVLVRPLVDQLSVQFLFFGSARRKLTRPRDQTIFLCPNNRFFLSSLDIRGWPIFKKDWTNNSREQTKKNCLVSEMGHFFFFWPKNEKLTQQFVSQRDWPKPHGHPFCKHQWCTRGRNFWPKTKVFTFRLSVSAAEIKGWIWPNVKFQIFFSKWTVKLENVYIWSSMKEWCFVTKSFLTYCEKKVF